MDLVVRMSESKCAERKRRDTLRLSLQVARDDRERAQCTDEGSCLLPIVVALAVMRAWGCGCGLYSDGGVEMWTRRLRLRNASDVDQDRPRSIQELRGLTRKTRATIAYHRRVHISIVAIVIRLCMLDAEQLNAVVGLLLPLSTLCELAQHARHAAFRQVAIANCRSILDAHFDTHKDYPTIVMLPAIMVWSC